MSEDTCRLAVIGGEVIRVHGSQSPNTADVDALAVAVAAVEYLMALTPCPECAAGKCRNCDGLTWDNDADDFGVCPCASAGHGEAGEPS